MLDQFCIFHRGGLVLFSRQFSLSSSSGPSAAAAPASTPVATLVRNVLLEGHTTTNEYKYDKYTLKWVYHSELQLYFVAVHLTQLALKFLYLDEFLERIRNDFVKEYKVEIESFAAAEQFSGFQRRYDRLLGDMLEKSSSVKKAPRSFEETAKGMNVDRDTVQGKKEMERRRLKLEKEKSEEAGEESQSDEGPNSPTAADGPASPSSASEPGFNPDKLKMLQKRQGPMRTGPPKKKDKSGPKSPESGSAAEDSAGKPIRKGKVMAQSDKATKKDMAALDFSKQLNADERLAADVEKIREVMGEAPKDSKVYEYQDEEEEDQNDEPEEEEDEKESSDQAKSGGIFGFFKSLVGAKELNREDLENVMKGVKATLMERNVAADIAEKVCESVTQSLIGKKVGSFTTIRSTVKSAMEESLTKILTPTKQVDLLEGIAAAQAQHRPYTIVFVGVNGVGKCWGRGTKLMMFDGTSKAVEDIVVGDQLMGDDGTPRIVLPNSLTRGTAPLYRITSKNPGRDSWLCNAQHILTIKINSEPTPVREFTDKVRSKPWHWDYVYSFTTAAGEIRIARRAMSYTSRAEAVRERTAFMQTWQPIVLDVPLSDYLDWGAYQKQAMMYQPDQVQFATPALTLEARITAAMGRQPTQLVVDLVAWALGGWLADGISDRSRIAQIAYDKNRPDHSHTPVIERILQLHGLTHPQGPRDIDWQYGLEEGILQIRGLTSADNVMYDVEPGPVFRAVLDSYGLRRNKHFPHQLLGESARIRRLLFEGMIDGDGSYQPDQHVYEMSAKHERFLDGFIHLVRGLGLTTKRKTARSNGNGWWVHVSGEDLHTFNFVLPYKRVPAGRAVQAQKDQRCDGFKVEVANNGAPGEYFGFQLSGNGRCIMDDFVVTHNSTSLSKICAYFLSKSLKVGMVAGDTFRSGAIEQLRTHATCLNVPLYAKGYERDAALVAADGILQAKRDGLDVVLIDTAGRMQDNEPLMRALSKLINLNKPDLILFVGEALVGNEAVDQAAKFNGCLRELSSDSTPRLIDGIVLTKFDTIDDKVGAAISMAYTTGKPIVFVGTGQTYEDLKRMNVKTLVKALLK